jgi:4-hydroxy-4-methyl-2-oxoglutarate aldolase
MSYANKIIDFCISNRVSTTEVADALGKSGVIPKMQPITLNKFCVGPVRAVFTANQSNYAVHDQIRDVQKGEVVIIFAHNCEGRAIIGDLISKFILLYKGAAAVVVLGLVRDAARLRREGYAIWAEGVTPLGCFNTPSEEFPAELKKEIIQSFENGVAVCDDGGVTVIPKDSLTEDMLNRLHKIEMQEDIWFFCLNTLKWDTKKIVCDKAYLTEQNLLSSIHIEQLKELKESLDQENIRKGAQL